MSEGGGASQEGLGGALLPVTCATHPLLPPRGGALPPWLAPIPSPRRFNTQPGPHPSRRPAQQLTVTVVCRLFPRRVKRGCGCSLMTKTRSDGALHKVAGRSGSVESRCSPAPWAGAGRWVKSPPPRQGDAGAAYTQPGGAHPATVRTHPPGRSSPLPSKVMRVPSFHPGIHQVLRRQAVSVSVCQNTGNRREEAQPRCPVLPATPSLAVHRLLATNTMQKARHHQHCSHPLQLPPCA